MTDIIQSLDQADHGVRNAAELLELAVADNDNGMVTEVAREVAELSKLAAGMEFKRMFSGDMDSGNAYLDIQAGPVGNDAQR